MVPRLWQLDSCVVWSCAISYIPKSIHVNINVAPLFNRSESAWISSSLNNTTKLVYSIAVRKDKALKECESTGTNPYSLTA